jgi:hypothetical protein
VLQSEEGVAGANDPFDNLFTVPDAVDATREDYEDLANAGLLAIRMVRPFAYELGDFAWFDRLEGPRTRVIDDNGMTAGEGNAIRSQFIGALLDALIDPTNANVTRVTSEELAALEAFWTEYPAVMEGRPLVELHRLVERWNRTRDYYELGLRRSESTLRRGLRGLRLESPAKPRPLHDTHNSTRANRHADAPSLRSTARARQRHGIRA